MKKVKWIILLLNLVVLLVVFNNSVVKKEALLSDGQLILLELAPIDPRSLIQGDYMRLRYAISEDIDNDTISKRGFCVVKLLPNGTAERVRLQENTTPLNENEHLIEYSAKNWWGINIGAESFFFQEGMGEKYEDAKYGGVKVDAKGNSLLVGLFDEDLKLIE
ncbi:GDYXXLXY domain-containing protein [Flagellimonas onchidii]|uniref:GDYXXLXY domain-containing protein n=1 Tax=Flagellimonas onchidii TaxID=2562684 RepID=UPI0010A68540|nr:GDYXXLXY domain-containing protein [Allomuricauda onchidii]